MKRAVIVILPTSVWERTLDRQLEVLTAFCRDERLAVASLVQGDPQAAVPLLADGLADIIVVPFADRLGMSDLAEIAAENAGGKLLYVHKRVRPNRMEKSINPIIARMLARNMTPEDISEVLDCDPAAVYEEIARSKPSMPRPRQAGQRPHLLTGRTIDIRSRIIG